MRQLMATHWHRALPPGRALCPHPWHGVNRPSPRPGTGPEQGLLKRLKCERQQDEVLPGGLSCPPHTPCPPEAHQPGRAGYLGKVTNTLPFPCVTSWCPVLPKSTWAQTSRGWRHRRLQQPRKTQQSAHTATPHTPPARGEVRELAASGSTRWRSDLLPGRIPANTRLGASESKAE